ncbi:TPA: hypothetical protein L5U90_003434 [Pseudomonas aeruginosa]|nr:hypothetical protein [Pseudomonas aeruginosa]
MTKRFKLIVKVAALLSPMFMLSSNADAASDAQALGTLGVTGYTFVDGVGWQRDVMVYCPAFLGSITPGQQLLGPPKNSVVNGLCGDLHAVSAQAYIDQLFGDGVAKVVSVSPAFGAYPGYGVIYYRAITE